MYAAAKIFLFFLVFQYETVHRYVPKRLPESQCPIRMNIYPPLHFLLPPVKESGCVSTERERTLKADVRSVEAGDCRRRGSVAVSEKRK